MRQADLAPQRRLNGSKSNVNLKHNCQALVWRTAGATSPCTATIVSGKTLSMYLCKACAGWAPGPVSPLVAVPATTRHGIYSHSPKHQLQGTLQVRTRLHQTCMANCDYTAVAVRRMNARSAHGRLGRSCRTSHERNHTSAAAVEGLLLARRGLRLLGGALMDDLGLVARAARGGRAMMSRQGHPTA